ncbi:T9SS type B sorting domain-containing protein [Chitinophaga sp.]|uniref:T9SS type B sorting domain-containing protein n=1 Tax=Chitinophaga sp. TaxID=1869181 RepID=UPI0031DC7C10
MKKILILLYSCLFLVMGIARAQSVYFNIPDTVCMSTNNSTADQAKFVSMNALLSSNQIGKANWTITTPSGSDADYTILYSDVNSTVKATQLTGTQALTIQFLTPGTYTFTVVMRRNNGADITRTKTIVAVNCTIQTCSGGNAEMPGFSENFGTLPANATRKAYSPASAITYIYQGTGDLNDNYYAISNTTQLRPEWVNAMDHSGLTRGGMLVANSDYTPSIFFQKEVNGLCRGSVYNFSAWLLNTDSSSVLNNNCVNGYKYAGVTFQILNAANTSQILAEFKTYAVSMNIRKTQWQRYGGSFTVPSGVTDVIVRIKNNFDGGCGNDIAVDDIEFQYCSPVITAQIEGQADNLKEVLCEGAPTVITSTYTPATYFTNPEYQWEMSDDGGVTWFNVPYGTANNDTLIIAEGELTATKTEAADYYFRVRIYESGSSSETCASPSSAVKITILPMPTLYLTKSQVCEGAVVELQASGGFDEFKWSDTSYVGPKRTITLKSDTTITVYGYIYYGIDGGKTCVDSNSASIKVDDKPIVEIAASPTAICVGSRVTFTINDALNVDSTHGHIYWYKGADSTGVEITDARDQTTMTYTTATIADSVFSVVVKVGECIVQSEPFIVDLTAIPAPPAGKHIIHCVDTDGYTFTPGRTQIAGTTGTWSYIGVEGPGVSDPANVDFSDYINGNIRNPGATFTLQHAGTTVYLQYTVKATNNASCIGYAYDTLTLVGGATAAYAGADTIQCGTSNVFTMTANEPNTENTGIFAETGTWSVISSNATNVTIDDIHAYNTTVTVTPIGTAQDVVLQWSIANTTGCATTYDTVVLHYNAVPTVTLKPVTVCNTATSFSLDTTATTGNPLYYSIAAAGTGAMPGFSPVAETPITTWPIAVTIPAGVAAGTYNFLLTVRNDYGGCTNTIPFSVNVESPSTAPTGVTVGSPNICTTGSTTLTVVGGDLGKNPDGTDAAQWVWYAGGCGTGTAIGTGPTITVTVSATTTFYVRAEGTGLCANSTCASGTVTVYTAPATSNAGPDQTHCNDSLFTMTANAATVGAGQWTLTGKGTITTPASPTTTVFVLAGDTATLTWTITNGACTTADQVVLINYKQPVQADAGPDSLKQCANTSFVMTAAAASPATATGTWSFFTGTQATIAAADLHNPAATITLPIGDTATAIWTVTNGTCSSHDYIKLFNYTQPTATSAGTNQQHCSDSLFTLTGSAPMTGATGHWYLRSGNATITSPASATTTVFVPAGQTATFRWVITNGVCADSSAVTLTNYLQPVTANAGLDSIVQCNNATFTMAATAPSPATATGTWSLYTGSAASIAAADIHKINAVITLPAGDTATAIWTVTNGLCATSDKIFLKNYQAPAKPNAGADQAHCNDSIFIITTTAPAVGIGTWTVSKPTATIISQSSTGATIRVPAGDSVLAIFTVVNGTCSAADTVKLLNYRQPADANAGPDQHHCNDANFTMAANAPNVTGAIGTWTKPTGSTATITSINSPTTAVTIPVGDSSMLFWTITNGTCTDTDTVWIVNNNPPAAANAGPDTMKQCNTAAFVMTANAPSVAGATGYWSVVSPASYTISAAQLNNPTATFNVTAGQTVVLTWTITNLGCTTSDNIVLINYEQPTAVSAGADQTKCAGTAFVMTASAVTIPGAVGTWRVASGNATITAGEEHNTNAHITIPNGQSAVLHWVVTNGVCADSAAVTLTNLLTPSAANAGPDARHCNDSLFVMAANAPDVAGATGTWSFVGTTTATISNVNDPAATITVHAGDSIRVAWTITNGTCPTTDTVTLVNYMAPTAAALPADMQQCMTTTFPVTANAPDVPNAVGSWAVIKGNATYPAADLHNTSTTFSVPNGDSAYVTWTITNGLCLSIDTIRLYNYQQPVAANAGPDSIRQCNTATFTMQATAASPATAVGKWSLYPGSAASFNPADSTKPNAVFALPAGDTATAIWTVSNGVCFSSDKVLLINSAMPDQANAGVDSIRQCNTTTFTMAANTPTVTGATGKWTLSNTRATMAPADTSNPAAVITVPVGDSVIATWTITNGACSTTDNIKLVNYAQPTAANAGPDQYKCATPAFTMAANTPSVSGATGTWSLPTGSTATISAADIHKPNAVITVPVGDSVIATWTITNGVCTSSSTVKLVDNAMPNTANAGPAQTHCNDSAFTMAANAPSVTGAVGTWSFYTGTKATIAAADIHNPAARIFVSAGDTATAIWTIANNACMTSSTVLLTNNKMPEAANAGPDQTHCNDSLFHMAATPGAIATSVGSWTVISGTATIAAADLHNPTASVIVFAGTSATLQWTLTNGTCTGTPATVTLTNLGPVIGNTISADQTLCATETPAALTGTLTLGGGNGTFTYQWQMSTTSATTGFANVITGTGGTAATYTPAALTADTVWFRRIVTSGSCLNAVSNVVKLRRITTNPVVVSVPASITTNCVAGRDYTTLFGTPVFSHMPFSNEALTVTYRDDTQTPDACHTIIMRTWTAVDRCGLTTSAQQTITVVDTTAPKFTTAAPANVTASCDNVPAAVNLTATDDCAGSMTITPIETRVDIPGQCTNNYYLIRKWVAVDNCGNVSDTLRQTVTVKDTTGPVFTGTAPANITVDCDKVPAATPLTATDNCTAGTITVNPVDTRQSISGAKCSNTYQLTRTWTATDACGNSTILKQVITVVDTTRPVFNTVVVADTTVNCDGVPAIPTITATDNCTASVKVSVAQTKVFLSTTCSNNYRLTRTWTATDDCGNVATMRQVITVQDTTRPKFTITPPADTTVSCSAVPAPPSNLSATDNCSAASNVKISYTQTRQSITGACASNYQLIRVWTAKDECGNTNTVRQVITVVDTTRPVIDPAPAAVTVTCGGTIPAAATLYATDNCDVNFPKKATMTTDPFTVDACNGYTITRRWNVTDACGNAAIERVQVITVVACPKPQLDTALPMNCSDNTKFALQLKTKVSKPTFTLQSVYPAGIVTTPKTQTSNVFDLNGATQATFIVTDGVTGCVSDPVTYNLRYVTKPTVNLGNDTAICQGNSVTLDAGAANATAGYTIRWNTGATTQQITVSAAGTYYATVTNNGCSATDSIRVTVNTPPTVNIPDTTICDGMTVKLNAYVQGATYTWSTGDTGPSITVSTAGTYTVDVTLKGCTVTDDATVTVSTPPNITLTPDTEICPNESVMLQVEPDGGTVKWLDGSLTNSIVVAKPGNYWVTVTKGGCVVADTVSVTNKANINFDLGPNKDICAGGLVVLNATNPDVISYLWNDGTTDPIKEVSTPGTYTVTVLDRFCNLTTTDSVKVTVAGIGDISLGNDTTICIGQTLTLKVDAGSGNSIRWQDGATTPTYVVTATGYYTVTVYNNCGTVTDDITVTYKACEGKPQFPNAFTPNGDGHNDTFKPVVTGTMYDYDLRIYNRWGELIFLSKESKTGWDGRYKGTLVDVGTYVWMLSYKKILGGPVNVVKGEVTVIR